MVFRHFRPSSYPPCRRPLPQKGFVLSLRSMPTDPLLTLETELHDLLLRREQLAAAWPRGRNPIERAKIGREVEDARTRIGEIMAEIANTPARTPLGLAVQLRRVQAAIEHDDRELAAHLVERAVVSCEEMAAAG